MHIEPRSRTPSRRTLPQGGSLLDGRLLCVAAAFFAAVCTAAALFVLATLSLPGTAHATDAAAAVDVAADEATACRQR